MFDFYQKRKLRGVVNSPITQGVILVLVLFVGWSAFVRYEIAMEMADRTEAAKAELDALTVKKDALDKQVQYLSNERGIEAEMRRQFDVALPGEKVVVILDDEDKSEIQPLATSTPSSSTKKWYQFWR